jgi:hypothetical protein
MEQGRFHGGGYGPPERGLCAVGCARRSLDHRRSSTSNCRFRALGPSTRDYSWRTSVGFLVFGVAYRYWYCYYCNARLFCVLLSDLRLGRDVIPSSSHRVRGGVSCKKLLPACGAWGCRLTNLCQQFAFRVEFPLAVFTS